MFNGFKKWGLRSLSIRGMTYLALLMAAELVLDRFAIGNSNVRFTFSFLIVALIAKWYGPFWSMGVAVIIDFISTMLSGQPYFIGFTISAVLAALWYSIWFYQQENISLKRTIFVSLIIAVIINIGLNSLWVAILAKTSFFYFLPIRCLKNLISFPIQSFLLYWFLNNQTLQRLKPNVFK
ncbi:hypothetical protein B808_648 [Fructilactobacillus florum 8D]|uniref:Substrate-specific component FolT of folate ECF transporter n=1 Tax=Fructilactobacillus florum 8D TaxID=1221538 RepID=W9EHH7_9LACO|nr:folate family ECF transporter S component [Fructilactobacillus florum]EKK21063.1 hypothetical protein B807_233 [Fructilactobacillus florum 2F]ETO40430.1 hypothetical protein B808_648 [Fructilactobacillus florum 8D]